uniref:Uncharacterized protein n=1 Tax=Crocodylus porosus TaxID=8502 RepID=A0A7M4EE11_CROPO
MKHPHLVGLRIVSFFVLSFVYFYLCKVSATVTAVSILIFHFLLNKTSVGDDIDIIYHILMPFSNSARSPSFTMFKF